MAGLSAFEGAIVNAGMGFAQSRLVAKIGDTLEDTAAFVGSLIGLSSGTAKQRLTTLKQDIKTLQTQQPTVNALIATLGEAKTALTAMGAAIGAGGVNGTVQATNQFATLLQKIDKAVEHVATRAAGLPKDQAVFDQVNGIKNPFVAIIADPANDAGAILAKGLDTFVEAVIGWKNATAELAKALVWDKATRNLTAKLQSVPATTNPKIPGFGFDGATLEAFLNIPGQVKAGLRLRAT